MGKTVSPRFLGCFGRIFFILVGRDDIHKSLDGSKFDHRLQISCPRASEIKTSYTYNGEMVFLATNLAACFCTFSKLPESINNQITELAFLLLLL